jgi:nucleotide-binding universal stress UspA family protein
MSDTNGWPILVGVDGSEASVDALRYAATLATAMNAPLRVVHVWEYPALVPYYPVAEWDVERDAAEVLSLSIGSAFGADVPAGLRKVLLQGSAARTLIEESGHSRMLVLGTRGAGGFARLLLGSVSSACAAHAQCPVLLIHAPVAEAPSTAEAHSEPMALRE